MVVCRLDFVLGVGLGGDRMAVHTLWNDCCVGVMLFERMNVMISRFSNLHAIFRHSVSRDKPRRRSVLRRVMLLLMIVWWRQEGDNLVFWLMNRVMRGVIW